MNRMIIEADIERCLAIAPEAAEEAHNQHVGAGDLCLTTFAIPHVTTTEIMADHVLQWAGMHTDFLADYQYGRNSLLDPYHTEDHDRIIGLWLLNQPRIRSSSDLSIFRGGSILPSLGVTGDFVI